MFTYAKESRSFHNSHVLVLYRVEAQQVVNFNIGIPSLTWAMLNAPGIPPNQRALFLAPTGGNLPPNDDKLTSLLSFIGRQGHLCGKIGKAHAAQNAR